jgi:DNA-binding protein HU-beta
LTKVELANEVAKNVGMTRAKTLTVVDAFFEAISTTLSKGGKLQVIGFGTFETRRRSARKGRNAQKPAAVIKIPAKTVPAFRARKALKEAVNSPNEK